ncbi:MAG TPA: Fe2+-dependent dioxygenase [Alphaproteobacteria bacterium]|nr:Fe2+-dependent dioxygenase [Alphaproteobacteria bacterium]
MIKILKPEQVAALREVLDTAVFADGAATAGWNAKLVKHNLQLTPGMAGYDRLVDIVRPAVLRDPVFQMAVRPRKLRPFLFNRHDAGMSYGAHVDDPVMGPGDRPLDQIRTDVSFTLFLSDPATYEGGELVIGGGGGERAYKLEPGMLVAYPSDSLHRVTPVTSGVRLACVGWVQSDVRDPARRAILYDLDLARRDIFAREGKNEAFDLITKAHANLTRMWVEL